MSWRRYFALVGLDETIAEASGLVPWVDDGPLMWAEYLNRDGGWTVDHGMLIRLPDEAFELTEPVARRIAARLGGNLDA